MTSLEDRIRNAAVEAIKDLYSQECPLNTIQVQKTRKDLSGDFTLVVFPLLRISRKNPVQTGEDLGGYILAKLQDIEKFEVVKGFLNFTAKETYWIQFLNNVLDQSPYGFVKPEKGTAPVLVEYSSPNTNKPLHLGHIRNNLLGYAVSKLLMATGKPVKMVNLVNDRGIHICKSMLAWQRWGDGITPEKSGMKGDRLVGDYYVRFEKEYQHEVTELQSQGLSKEEAAKKAPMLLDAQEMLRKWEAGDSEVTALWEMMNQWVYTGFDTTYKSLGIAFDKVYYESQTYKMGKQLVLDGLEAGVLYKKDDSSVWADLTDSGLDEKLLLRSDGTSVYMTQDLGTAHQRHEEFGFQNHVYVVGNEQNYHFKVLALILKKLGFDWAEQLHHLSYGMVELPDGKMKSREGKVVDADELIEEMVENARQVSKDLGKLDGFEEKEKEEINYRIAMAALKYFILKVDPVRTMLFNPKESIDFNGNTGPFIQYTYVRIKSVLRKAEDLKISIPQTVSLDVQVNEQEIQLIKLVYSFPELLQEAGRQYSPALLANYLYELVKAFNQFYQHSTIINEENSELRGFRLSLASFVARHIQDGMRIMGIEMPERM
ncbi:MAG: arginine--tRNA ligase [Bacteroidetes bacterium]|nr:arginine--tRNA ligase [Bacteroidota bacterium]MBT4398035.1 arginine--tRNA ligase [Bacteroidota bacterium]MBT4411289.1 arginine--tRNA ligase [Bacteroidota bacterium]